MILYVLLIPVLILNLDRLVVQPLKAIRDAMIFLKGGDQDYRIPYRKASEEFLVIDETFNDMADRLKTLKIENYETRAGETADGASQSPAADPASFSHEYV